MQTVQKWLTNKANQPVLFWLIGGLLFRGFIALWLPPGFDEAYYYVYSQHLDWSYFDHPVLVALTTGFGTWLTGDVSQFTIRLGTLILHTGSLLLLYLTSVRLFSVEAGRLTLAIATIIPIFQVGFGVLTLPDNPLIFFWTATLYCAGYEFFPPSPTQEYRPSYRLSYFGVLVGLACLGKYHGFVLGLGLVGFCLTSPRHRRALLSPWAWLALSLFIVTIFPIWFWNIQHDWVSFRFQLDRGVPREDYDLLDVVDVLLAEVAYLFPTLGLPLWWVSLQSLRTQITSISPRLTTAFSHFFPFLRGARGNRNLAPQTNTNLTNQLSKQSSTNKGDFQQKQLLILWVSLPLTIGFTLMGGYQQILPTWPVPGFWGLSLLLGQQAVLWQQQSRRWVRRWLQGSGWFIGTCLLLALLHVTTGTLQTGSRYAILGGFWNPKDDPSTELIDIVQLRQGFAQSPLLSQALQKSSFVFTNGYYLAGFISMALTPLADTPITCFSTDLRGFAFWSRADQWVGEDALFITISRFQKKESLLTDYRGYFKSLEELGSVPIRRGGGVIEQVYVYQAKSLVQPYPRLYGI